MDHKPIKQQGAYYLDDFIPGQKFISGEKRVTQEEVITFAKEFDPQSFHVDPEAAKKSVFGGIVASGWHTASMSMRLILDTCPIAEGRIGLGGDITWPAPTKPGDIIHVEVEVMEVRPSTSKPDRGIVTLRSTTKNHRGETVQILTARTLMMKRPEPI
ncbi:MAG: MaoC family dehydratase [Alphaproteobacteria bacterium]|jgi:acyl dehydratase|nr:MaoC family dehydratase [Alphaproteobacteria bacterium]